MWTHKASITLGGGLIAQAGGVVLRSYALAAIGTVLIAWVAWAYVTRRRPAFEGEHEVSNDRAFEGDAMQVSAKLTSKGLGLGWVEVRDPLPPSVQIATGTNYRIAPLNRRELRLEYSVRLPFRGLYGFGPVESRHTGLFSMFEDIRTAGGGSALLVMPYGEELDDVPLKSLYPKQFLGDHSVRSPGIGSNFYALRDYTPADEMRMVNWKATARTGKLVVNQWQRETLAEVTLFIDARAVAGMGTVGNNPLLRCARAAAALTQSFLSNKNIVRLVIYGKEVRHLHSGGGEQYLYKVLAELAEMEPEGDIPFNEALHRMLPFLKPRTPVWLFSSLADDPDMADGAATLSAFQNPVYVVTPDLIEALATARENGATISDEDMMERRGERELAMQSLRGLGAMIIDWKAEDRLSLAIHKAEVAQ